MSIKTAIDKLTGKSSKNIEDAISKLDIGGGGSGGITIISETTSGSTQTLTKTFKEIYDCFDDGGFAVVMSKDNNDSIYIYTITGVYNPSYEGQGYTVDVLKGSNRFSYIAQSEDAYPSYTNIDD